MGGRSRLRNGSGTDEVVWGHGTLPVCYWCDAPDVKRSVGHVLGRLSTVIVSPGLAPSPHADAKNDGPTARRQHGNDDDGYAEAA